MSYIAIIAALPGELKPLIGEDWHHPEPNVWTGSISHHGAVAISGGIGAAAAGRAVAKALSYGWPDALISYGWAGALTCALKPPAAFAISDVIDHGSGERFATRSPQGTRLVTLDHVAHPDEKRTLAQAHQAVLVDMEAAAVGRLAAERNIPFYCFKGISDAYTDHLPDFGSFISPAGELRTAALVAHAVLRPAYWASLIRLGRNSSLAASNLARSLSNSLPQSL